MKEPKEPYFFSPEVREKFCQKVKQGIANSDKPQGGLRTLSDGSTNTGRALKESLKSKKELADAFALEHAPEIERLRQEGTSYNAIAISFNKKGITGRKGGKWTARLIKNVLQRVDAINNKQ